MSPNPKLKVLSSSQLELRWDIPYTHEPYPVERYDIQILNTSSGHKVLDSVTQNRYVYLRAGEGTTQTKCDLLMFSVSAINELGQSVPGNVSGGFPIGRLYCKHCTMARKSVVILLIFHLYSTTAVPIRNQCCSDVLW